MGLISCQFSDEYLTDISYIFSLKESFSALGAGWHEIPLLSEKKSVVPKKSGIFFLFLKDKLSNIDSSVYTRTIVFIGGDTQQTLYGNFTDLLAIFKNKAIDGYTYTQEILKFDTRRQCGDLVFSYLETSNINHSEIKSIINKLKTSYSPPGNWFHKAKLDYSNIEPAF